MSDWKEVLGTVINKRPEEVARNTNAISKKEDGKKVPEFFTDDDYVSRAEKCMKNLGEVNYRNKNKRNYHDLTSSQMRNLFALVTRVYNTKVLASKPITPADIGSIKVRMVYEAGRKADVERFLSSSELLTGLDYIGMDKDRFLRYERYMEALVAYHYYYNSSKD